MWFLLPHEVLAVMHRVGDEDKLYDRAGYDPLTLQHLLKCEASAGCQLLGVGLWGDGAPCNWDRSETMEVLSWNLPGQAQHWKNMRIPITSMSKKHVAATSTYDDIFAVLSWSFECLAIGKYPHHRHDGRAWLQSDAARRRSASSDLPLKAALVEVRGDWKFYKEVFNFPAWNERAGICWLCTCTPQHLREVGETASWRQDHSRCSHWDMMLRIRANGAQISSLFSAPWVCTSIFKIDWLHAVDQGIAADFAGNFLMHLVRYRMQGQNMKARCSALWLRLQAWYEAQGVQDRLQNLTLGMLCKEKASPKLRASAAQVRALVPWLWSLGQDLLADDDDEEVAMASAAYHLLQCYRSLSHESIFFQEVLTTSSRLFALQYVALESHALGTKNWRAKPKLHLFLELASSGSQPSLFWTYRDEDFGGACAKMSRRRGGMAKPGPSSSGLLHRWRIKHPVPRLA